MPSIRSLTLLAAVAVASALPGQRARAPGAAGLPAAGCVTLAGSGAQRLQNGQRWPQGLVPYALDASVTPTMAQGLQAAMQEIQSRVRVQFVPRTVEADYVVVRDAPINSSPIGRQGGAQTLFVSSWGQRFEVVHALMHVLGFWHEHQRPDRDQYVSVQTQNIDPARSHEFALVPIGDTYGLPYDFDSVLHFGGNEAGLGGAVTLVALPPNQQQQAAMGQRTHLSLGDVEALRRAYGSLLPPAILQASPGAVPSYQSPSIFLAGERFDEATRVTFRGAPASYVVLSPTQLRINLPSLVAIGPGDVVVESGAGLSAPFAILVTGNSPPRLEGPPVLNSQLAFPFRIYSDAGHYTLLLASLSGQPSVAPGIVSLGLGAGFSTYDAIAIGLADASGLLTVNLTGPRGLVPGTSIWLQAVAFDLANFTLPLSATNVLSVRAF